MKGDTRPGEVILQDIAVTLARIADILDRIYKHGLTTYRE